MPSGVLLGIATAVSWGSSDFFARFATRTTGTARALLGMQSWGAIFVTIFFVFSRDWGHLFDGSGWQPWAWGVLAGAINTAAMFALYRAFELGKMAVVAPISASYPALTVTLSMLSGEKLSLYRGLGIVAAFVGVILVAAGEKPGPQAITGRDVENDSEYSAKQNSLAGIFWAIAAAVGFGFLFWFLGTRIIPRTGAIATVWLIRWTGTAITLCAVLASRIPLRVRNKRTRAQLYSMGFFDTAAFALSNLGMRIEQVAVVSVLGSLYGAITVALAAVFLRERIAPRQWSGIAAIFLGIVFMNA
jgi:drug/metabolite transporter (DMT)-like permease